MANKPDLNAPRHRLDTMGTLNRPFYAVLRETHPELDHLPDSEISAIVRGMNELIMERVISHRDGVELPRQLGYIFMGTCPPKVNKNTDFRRTADYMQAIEHRNYESDGHLMKIFYTNWETKYRFKHHEYWGFKACREFTRSASAAYTQDWKKYIQIDHSLKVSRMFRTSHYRIAMEQKLEEELKTYDELAL